jgi:hypothetical protein
VPFLGAITEIKYRRNEFAHKREQILIKRKRRVHMIVFITFFNVISLIMASSIVVLGSFLGASLTVKYNPTPYSFKKLDVSDNRIGNLQEQYQAMTLNKTGSTDPRIYSALTYNTGFNAYNHNMHFFMDEDGHFFNGQSRAESAVAISQSINGIARTLGSDHDTAIEGEYNYN